MDIQGAAGPQASGTIARVVACLLVALSVGSVAAQSSDEEFDVLLADDSAQEEKPSASASEAPAPETASKPEPAAAAGTAPQSETGAAPETSAAPEASSAPTTATPPAAAAAEPYPETIPVATAPEEPAKPAAAAAPRSRQIEEIVVTAQRREESLQDVPVAVTALSGDDIENLQVTDVSALQNTAPNMLVSKFPGDNSSANISIRGFFSAENLITVDNPVGLYIDGVYVARSAGGNLDMVDVGRIEVLRGPQGTLFGRNTIGGAVNLVPNRPSDSFEGSVKAGFGNFGLYEAEAVLNAPLGASAGLRLALKHGERDGYAKSSLTGTELNSDEADFARVQFAAEPLDGWDLLLAADYSSSQNQGQWVTLLSFDPTGLAEADVRAASGGADSLGNYVNRYTDAPPSNTDGSFEVKVWGGSASLTHDMDWATFKSITAWRELERTSAGNDLDATPYTVLLMVDTLVTQEQFSQELQLFGKALSDDLDWIVGAYYFKEEGLDYSLANYLQPLLAARSGSITEGEAENGSWALYTQLSYRLLESLRATAGVRYTEDTRSLTSTNRSTLATGQTTCPNPDTLPPECRAELPKRDFRYVPFTLGLEYDVTDGVMSYLKWSRGFRAGGYNMRGTNGQTLAPFEPEQVDSYELGIKSDLLDRRLRLNAAIFSQVFSDIQVIATVPGGDGTPTTSILNAAKARVNGLELEAVALLGDLRLSAAYGYLSAEYTEVDPQVTDLNKDTRFRAAPENTASVAADYPMPLSFGELRLHADYAWKDQVSHGLVPPGDRAVLEDAYGLLNARVGLQLNQPNLEFALWGRNLTDEEYLTGALDLYSALGFSVGYPGEPRVFGVSAMYRF